MQSNETFERFKQMTLDRMEWARGYTLALIEGLSDEQLIARAGGKGNHALWIMGHLASTDDYLLHAVAGQEMQLDEATTALFGSGSEPVDDASAYPSRRALFELMQQHRLRITQWFESLDETSAWQALPEPLRIFAPDAISMAVSLSGHDMIHAGQITAVRASLGLPRLMDQEVKDAQESAV